MMTAVKVDESNAGGVGAVRKRHKELHMSVLCLRLFCKGVGRKEICNDRKRGGREGGLF